jgi:protein-disulfide isomerase
MFSAAAATLKTPVTERDHLLGPPDAPVTLLEYGDFQCPHCGRAHPIVESLRAQFGNRMRFAFRHFPLVKSHPQASLAAEAAEAAGAQGKFWEISHTLFTHQQNLRENFLIDYARELGLDTARFEADLKAHTFGPRVREDLGSGLRSGVNGTPTFFVNGIRQNGYDQADLTRAVQSALDGAAV